MKKWSFKKGAQEQAEENTPTGEVSLVEDETQLAPAKKIRRGLFSRLRWESKRDRKLAELSTGYQQLVGLMGSIQHHLELQSERQDRFLGSLEHLPEVAEGLKKIGRSTEQQAETLGLMRDQLDSSVEHDKQLINSMSRFNDTLSLMNKTQRRMAFWKIVFLLLALTLLATGVYLGLNDASKEALSQKAAALFAPAPELIETEVPVTDTPERIAPPAPPLPTGAEEAKPQTAEGKTATNEVRGNTEHKMSNHEGD